MIPYMYCRLDLNIRELQVYQILYKKCDFKTWTIKCTTDQIIEESDKCLGLTKWKVENILKYFKNEGMLIEQSKGRKGHPTIYKLVRHADLEENRVENEENDKKSPTLYQLYTNSKGKENQPNELDYKPVAEVSPTLIGENTNRKPTLNQHLFKEQRNKDIIYIPEELFTVQKKLEGDTTQLNATIKNVIAAYPKTIQSSKDEKASIKLIQQLLMEGYTEQDLIRFSENYYKDYKSTNKNDMYLANCSNFYEFKYKEYIGLNKQEHKIKDYNSNGIFTL